MKLLFVFILCLLPIAVKAEKIIESRYRSDADYRIRASLNWATTHQFGHNTIVIRYSVFRNGEFLHAESADGGTIIGSIVGRWKEIDSEVRIEPIENIGWMINVGAIRGNTYSDFYAIICPSHSGDGWLYKQETFIAKFTPLIRRSGEYLEVWSYYQDWGRGGTAISFYVPELRRLFDDGREFRIMRSVLPPDLSSWPIIDDVGSIGVFVAGIAQLNPDIMEAVIPHLSESDREHFQLQGLPTSEPEMRNLISEIRVAKKLKEKFSQFDLDWTTELHAEQVAAGNDR